MNKLIVYFLRHDSFRNKSLTTWLLAVGVAVSLNYSGDFFRDKLYFIFAAPAAWIAGLFFNVSPVINEQGFMVIPLVRSSIQVTPDCSAYGFFCIMTAIFILFYQDIKCRMPMIGKVGAILLMAYVITIITNGFRIISGYEIHLIVGKTFLASARELVHFIVGITTFLTVILLVYLILEWRVCYDNAKEKTITS